MENNTKIKELYTQRCIDENVANVEVETLLKSLRFCKSNMEQVEKDFNAVVETVGKYIETSKEFHKEIGM